MPIGAMFENSQAQDANRSGMDASLGYLDKIRSDVAPMFQTGSNIFQMLSDPNALMKNFYTSPDYQWRMQQGMNGVNTNKAVNGLLRSGGAIKASSDYASNQASQEFGNYWNRQMGLVDRGLTGEGLAAGAAGNMANVRMEGAANAGNLDLAQGNNIDNMIGGIFSSFGA
jgi:hypothetical protein